LSPGSAGLLCVSRREFDQTAVHTATRFLCW
jgi:hypothetical protein